ncbi:ATP-binding protein [Paenibacillus sp.]|uniref:ATP-binding protein n=1 Tax=Paenibacillus sp. TaxID=58172 RepID=UPI002811BCDA|nr:ATP-binding protein [Paenibacillus sp.]
MNLLEQLLLNVLFLIVFLLFIPILLELNLYRINRQKHWIYSLSTALAVILCIAFPVEIMEGYIFDLRLVALTLGGLYGSAPTIFFLAGATVLSRFLLVGGSGALATAMVVSVVLIVLLAVRKTYAQAGKRKKIVVGSAVSLFAGALALLNSTLLFGATFSIGFVMGYIAVTLSVTALLLYFYELFHEFVLIHKQVMKAEKMEIVSHLAASVSHEVRNPLTAVRGFLQLMLRKNLSEEQREEYVRISLDEIDRANDIIQSYLLFAKPTAGKIEILNIKEEIDRSLQLLMPLANMNSVEIDKRVDDYFVRGEEKTLQHCLINLMKNCIEAMPSQGKLRIETVRQSDELRLSIVDNGKGMTEEQLARLGEPYFTTKGDQGTGLGMMVAMKIIDSMNGELRVVSKPDEGTEFHIRLPLVGDD